MANLRSVKANILRDYKLTGWKDTIAGRWSYRDLAADPAWFKGWISFDTVRWNSNDHKLYCGLNSMDGDLLYTFDPRSGEFESLETKQWTDEFDVKIHRTLLLNPNDGCLYFGTSLLHDADQQREAKGGKLVRFDPKTRKYEMLSVPVPHLYIQSIAADWQREIIYGFTYPAEAVFKSDLRSKRSEIFAYIGNAIMFAQPHNAVVDRNGWLWGTYAETRAWDETTGQTPIRLFKYHPDSDEFVWFDHGLSRREERKQLLLDPHVPQGVTGNLSETRHKEDFGFCDSMAYDGDRYIYAGTVAGVLSRIDTQTGSVEKVANVMGASRLPALGIRDGILYGGGGMNGHTQLIRWDSKTDRMESFANLIDSDVGERPVRIHDLDVDDNHTIFLAENDNHARSSFLWTVHID